MKVASEIEICSFQSLFTLPLRTRLWKFALPWESGSDSADLLSSLSGTSAETLEKKSSYTKIHETGISCLTDYREYVHLSASTYQALLTRF